MPDLTIGFFHSDEKGTLLHFSKEGKPELLTIDLDELKNQNLTFAYVEVESLSPSTLLKLEKEGHHFPLKKASDAAINLDKFKKLTWQNALEERDHSLITWSLKNNISFIENLPLTVRKLKKNLLKNWETGLTQLWTILKQNLATTELTFFFSDLSENKKNTLVKRKISGQQNPTFADIQPLDQEIMNLYEGQYKVDIGLLDHVVDKGQLEAIGMIQGCQFLFLAKTKHLSLLQKALLKALFQGINQPNS